MKFAIVLLGLVALSSAQLQSRNIITDTVSNLVSTFTSKVFGDLDKVVADIKGITSNSLGKGNGILSIAKGELHTITGKVESDLNEMISKGGEAKTCALNQLAQLGNIRTDAVTKVESCAGNLADAVVSYEHEIVNSVTELKSSIGNLGMLAKDCTKDLLNAITCAISKINAGKEIVDAGIDNITNAVELSRTQADRTVQNIQNCATSVVDTATQQVHQINANMQRCL